MPLFGLSNPGVKAERMIRTERDPCRNPGVGIGNSARNYRRRAGRGTVAAVHARMTLTAQPSVGGNTAPRPRSNVMSWVVHQKPAGWVLRLRPTTPTSSPEGKQTSLMIVA